MYIYMCVCVCVCMYARVCVDVCSRAGVYTRIYAYEQAYALVCV